jgi:aspartokinase-like uncharacterized kinase
VLLVELDGVLYELRVIVRLQEVIHSYAVVGQSLAVYVAYRLADGQELLITVDCPTPLAYVVV